MPREEEWAIEIEVDHPNLRIVASVMYSNPREWQDLRGEPPVQGQFQCRLETWFEMHILKESQNLAQYPFLFNSQFESPIQKLKKQLILIKLIESKKRSSFYGKPMNLPLVILPIVRSS